MSDNVLQIGAGRTQSIHQIVSAKPSNRFRSTRSWHLSLLEMIRQFILCFPAAGVGNRNGRCDYSSLHLLFLSMHTLTSQTDRGTDSVERLQMTLLDGEARFVIFRMMTVTLQRLV
jgi:hypothetical protein